MFKQSMIGWYISKLYAVCNNSYVAMDTAEHAVMLQSKKTSIFVFIFYQTTRSKKSTIKLNFDNVIIASASRLSNQG